MQRIVVGAVLVNALGEVLAARRASPPELAAQWEFPGGKVEDGEAETVAVERELREELAVEAAVLRRIDGAWPISDRLVLHLYLARILAGEPAATSDHDEVRWVDVGVLETLLWLPVDRLALPAVVRALSVTP